MNANGQSAARMMTSIAHYMQQLPQDSEVWLVREETAAPKYSVYVLSGLDVLEFGEGKIGPIYGRPDIKVKFVSKQQVKGLAPDDHRLVLKLKDGVATQHVLPGRAL